MARHKAVTPCQCEHDHHFAPEPFGTCVNPVPMGHPYGKVPSDTRVRTLYGTFNLCAYCHNAGHMNIGKAG